MPTKADIVYVREFGAAHESASLLKFLEASRLFPVGLLLVRDAAEDVILTNVGPNGDEQLAVERGVRIVVDMLGMHSNPRLFPYPEAFKPERWYDTHENDMTTFSMGPRVWDDLPMSLSRHEHYVCAMLQMKPGLKVLLIGSGNGDVAMELVRYADVDVVGVDFDIAKVRCATARVKAANLSHRIEFRLATLERLSSLFPPSSFDVVYAIESLKAATGFESIYHDICALLKPGGKAGIVEWCWTAKFDTNNIDHLRLAELIESTAGLPHRAPRDRSINTACDALQNAGMTVMLCEDLGAKTDRISWFAPLEKALSDSRLLWSDGETISPIFGGMTRITASAIVQAAKYKLFTPMALFIAQKNAHHPCH
ncbi:hypothetical protein NM688_g4724 [Phlebia brevispora]|uniref:Uncharacterized protein n=1 Tax=Phlebia brevispora TaxID=194682 RepID=A0ACC1T243_9APHY|nr:hypothetical protein NM688_g4724 [Phlebia brevispora]